MSKDPTLNIKVLPARQGIAWLAQSLILVRAQPARLFFLAVLVQLILGLTRLPLIGLFIVMTIPALSAGLLQGFSLVAAGQSPAINTLFLPLTSSPRTGRLLALGALMFAVGILAVSLVLAGNENMIDAELLARIEQGDMDALASIDPAFISSMILAIVVGVSVSGTLSYLAIPLIWFHNQKLGAALITGLKALFLNWKPFTLLTLGLAVLLIPVALVTGFLFQFSGSAGVFSFVLLGLIMLIALGFQLAIFGTQFCSFQEIFEIDDGGLDEERPIGPGQDDEKPDQDSSDDEDGQLLA